MYRECRGDEWWSSLLSHRASLCRIEQHLADIGLTGKQQQWGTHVGVLYPANLSFICEQPGPPPRRLAAERQRQWDCRGVARSATCLPLTRVHSFSSPSEPTVATSGLCGCQATPRISPLNAQQCVGGPSMAGTLCTCNQPGPARQLHVPGCKGRRGFMPVSCWGCLWPVGIAAGLSPNTRPDGNPRPMYSLGMAGQLCVALSTSNTRAHRQAQARK